MYTPWTYNNARQHSSSADITSPAIGRSSATARAHTASFCRPPRARLRVVDELTLRGRGRGGPRRVVGGLARLARVELGDDLGADAVELLLGEDAQQRPGEVERVENGSALVRACSDQKSAPKEDVKAMSVGHEQVIDRLVRTSTQEGKEVSGKTYPGRRTASRTCRGTPKQACLLVIEPPHQQLPSLLRRHAQ